MTFEEYVNQIAAATIRSTDPSVSNRDFARHGDRFWFAKQDYTYYKAVVSSL